MKRARRHPLRSNNYSAQANQAKSLVESMIAGRTNPLVAISVVGGIDRAGGGVEVFRSMGFIVERIGSAGIRLIATCRHAVSSFGAPGNQPIVAFKNPMPTILQCIGGPIEDTEPESDIAFLLVRDQSNAPTNPFVIQSDDLPIAEAQILYNAGNQCDPVNRIYDVQVNRQVTKERNAAFCKLSTRTTEIVPDENRERQEALVSQGWIRHRMVQMVSRPSFSGSPIWDDHLRLYGMDVRGSSPGDDLHKVWGDVTICLPTSALHVALQRVQIKIAQRLNDLKRVN